MPTRHDQSSLSRRDLIKIAGAALVLPQGAALAAPPPRLTPTHAGANSMMGVPFEAKNTVRVAIVGTGLRGSSVLGEFLAIDNVQITALCDIVPEKVDPRSQASDRCRPTGAGDVHGRGSRLRESRQAG